MKAGKETEMYNQGYMDGYNDAENAQIDPDYWERLKHQYVGQAMQGLMSILPQVGGIKGRSQSDEVTDMSITIATKLIEKLKEERK